MQYVASLSYGKDSMAMLHVIRDVLDWPLDRIITAEIWATDTIQADLPQMVEFKAHADEEIKRRWGIEVEHYHATWSDGRKRTFENQFHTVVTHSRTGNNGMLYGFPMLKGSWCVSDLKVSALKKAQAASGKCEQYIGIAVDEPVRVERHIKGGKLLPLVDAEWTEAMCREWCEKEGLLSPIYTRGTRGGCWFCPKQRIDGFRQLRKDYPELWALLLQWQHDEPRKKMTARYTVDDLERRFSWEDAGYLPSGKAFKWSDLDWQQMNVYQFIKEEDKWQT